MKELLGEKRKKTVGKYKIIEFNLELAIQCCSSKTVDLYKQISAYEFGICRQGDKLLVSEAL